jgi:hypothetical protein
MKKIGLLIAIFTMAFIATTSARNWQEVVYLKNGSIIKGIVIEQIPGVSLKIQTYDGSIFAYPMADVERITKEEITRRRNNTARPHNEFTLDKSYRGFVELGPTFGVGALPHSRLEVMTTHGYQILPQLFVGGGVGFHYFVDPSDVAIPIYADVRTDLLNRKATPYIDLKMGYSVVAITGYYLSPTIGYSFKLQDKARINLGVSYSLQNVPYTFLWNGYMWGARVDCSGISIKLGVDF